MKDYEYLILQRQESEDDDCRTCPYKGVNTCKNQCMGVEEHGPLLEDIYPQLNTIYRAYR